MKKYILVGILSAFTTFFSSILIAQYGQFAEAKCPIPISEELANSGNFSFGYMTVPEFHGKPVTKTIELAVAIFKCRNETATYEPLVLNTPGPTCIPLN